MNSIVIASEVHYKEVGFMGGDLQFMLWFIAALIFIFACARDSALHAKLFPHRPSIYRTWRMAAILIGILLALGVPAGDLSRSENLAFNINEKYENVNVTDNELKHLMDIYNKGRGDQLVFGYGKATYYLVANASNEPTLTLTPGSTAEEPRVSPRAQEPAN